MGWGAMPSGAHHIAEHRTPTISAGTKTISRLNSRRRENSGTRNRNPANRIIQFTSMALAMSPSTLEAMKSY
jgi:hypothetical protein